MYNDVKDAKRKDARKMEKQKINQILNQMGDYKCEHRGNSKIERFLVVYPDPESEMAAVVVFKDAELMEAFGYISSSIDEGVYVIDEVEFIEEAYEFGIDQQAAQLIRDVLRNRKCKNVRISSALPEAKRRLLCDAMTEDIKVEWDA